ncbi:hypothetical protein HPB50_019327 [Hyalomma asiaticum]|uniref:Uncharacterized protein n=1 Tax=Hyalomma asiaticum TaxID=266040 RepID=A0ACB7RVJ0_HYAAI|nr:hypothetical protein HPB50_019327 [Hyalomma asiaticum]
MLVQKTLTAQKQTRRRLYRAHLVEALPELNTPKRFFVVNVHSPPRDQMPDFDRLMKRDIEKLTSGHQVLLVGVLNASYTAWGHAKRKGPRIQDATQHHGLTLCYDPL